MNIAIIPARGGSKRIPGKNMRPFFGKPIIQYSITAAIESGLFSRVIVSTDSQVIADLATRFGAEVPFIRDADISDDFTPVADVVHHALVSLHEKHEPCEYACCILATAPFVRTENLRKGLNTIKAEKVASVFAVTTYPFPIFRALKITEEKRLEMFWPEHKFTRSNDLPEAYHDAGQFYWLDVRKFIKNKEIYTSDAVPVIIPRFLVQDIDTEEDWETAETIYQAVTGKGGGVDD
ncbi:MAG: pseudaminic acid cytidylyltransferase [Candidatus Brocadiaceae bacterium]|nr:pseudaminic acid cytidylyltransferase [Candidatus Brocadiaceae bacterium]